MVSPDEVAEEYRAALSELTRNDKTQINLLTILAEDYASYASAIVAVIEERLFKCPSPMKIVMLYVLDSIVKNIPATSGAYRDLFAKRIVDMIVHVFKEGDEKTRASVYRLRSTWSEIFRQSCLYAIDMRLNRIDKAWPILTPRGVVHVNPLFLNGKPQQQPVSLPPPVVTSVPPPVSLPPPVVTSVPPPVSLPPPVVTSVPPPVSLPPPVVTSVPPPVSLPPPVANPPPMVQNGGPLLVEQKPPPLFFPRGPIQQQQQHHIQNVTPKLPGVPENNRIFVDGKAYEVFYLDDVAAIERNGLPHRVSFAGPDRDVVIDGTAYRMAFGQHKQVLIDGDLHTLRFGAPSRELFMGNFPFKGAFGGPPIIATINQRRHEIRLCGPPPEVRIDPEPSYELMRYMPAVRQQQPTMVQLTKTDGTEGDRKRKRESPPIDVSRLLKRLKETGLLTQPPNEAERNQRKKQVEIEANAAPIPSNHRLDNIERRATPMSGLEQFSMRSLIIRYDSVIDAIHRPRVVCQYCGIAFQKLYNEAYQRHADWHLQKTIRIEDQKLNKGPKVVKGTSSQPWYMVEDWFDFSETELVNRTQGMGGADKSAVEDEKGTAAVSHQHTAGTNRDAPSEIVESKECQVCHEQFEEYWDEEEDVWRLRHCLLSDGKAFHIFCKEDVIQEEADMDLRC
ncbi:hypothetical protein niasHS_013548 [Heterodera schachtii]|uniref:CID domain-containing protein n=1 Tax=Heterodera schachtii TaxID=97005 RepID=A0ABD2IE43_HETSC